MSPDEKSLTVALAELHDEFRQRRWLSRGIVREARREVFYEHIRRLADGGVDEALVTVRMGAQGSIVWRFYALPAGQPEWLRCDRTAFEGFLSSGRTDVGRAKAKRTMCACGKLIHRSGIRARRHARKLSEEYGTTEQRSYRCEENIRAFHLSSKRNGVPIPGAFIGGTKEAS